MVALEEKSGYQQSPHDSSSGDQDETIKSIW